MASSESDVNTRATNVVAQATGQTPKRKKDPQRLPEGVRGPGTGQEHSARGPQQRRPRCP